MGIRQLFLTAAPFVVDEGELGVVGVSLAAVGSECPLGAPSSKGKRLLTLEHPVSSEGLASPDFSAFQA